MAAASDLERRARNAFIEYRYDRAVALFSEAIALQPGNEDKASLLAFRSRANLELDKIYDACADAVAAHEIDPHLIVAKILMGDCLMKCNKYGSAGNCYSSALENATDDDLRWMLLPKVKICLELSGGLAEPPEYCRDVTGRDTSRLISVRGELAGLVENAQLSLCAARYRFCRKFDFSIRTKDEIVATDVFRAKKDFHIVRRATGGLAIGALKEMMLHRANYPQVNLASLEKMERICEDKRSSEEELITRLKMFGRVFGGLSQQLETADIALEVELP